MKPRSRLRRSSSLSGSEVKGRTEGKGRCKEEKTDTGRREMKRGRELEKRTGHGERIRGKERRVRKEKKGKRKIDEKQKN